VKLPRRFWILLCLLGCPKFSDGAADPDAPEQQDEGDEGSIDSERRLDQLQRLELQALCQDLNTELGMRFDNQRLATYACTRRYLQGSDSLTCNLNVGECVRQSPEASLAAPRPVDFQIDNAECAAIGACRLSVGVFDRCLGDRFDQSEQLLARVSCALANDPEAVEVALGQIDSGRAVPQSCAAVAANCPGLL
jgi:hypothetical protein